MTTYVEWVQELIPGISKDDADKLLWECTPFPIRDGHDDLLPYIQAVREELKRGTTLQEIIDENYRRMSEQIAADVLAAEGQIMEERRVPKDIDLPEHVKSRPTIIIESDLL